MNVLVYAKQRKKEIEHGGVDIRKSPILFGDKILLYHYLFILSHQSTSVSSQMEGKKPFCQYPFLPMTLCQFEKLAVHQKLSANWQTRFLIGRVPHDFLPIGRINCDTTNWIS
jgi:hypothetical protein